ncbi:ribose-5-phosphate isomerase [Cladochytrium replicatum]|nr:ribose-5-phosphate isomerase [Cladochytrium replicatum]
MSLIEKAKQQACFAAVDEYVTSETKFIGIGSGTTVVFCVERLKQRTDAGELNARAYIPTSFQAKQLILDANLPLGDLNQFPELDVAFDGADEVDSELNCIKGGGGCHVQERLVAYNAKTFVVVADDRKDSEVLGERWNKGVPVEVLPLVYVPVLRKLKQLGGNAILRMSGGGKAGPVVTDNGNFIIDVDFGKITRPREIDAEIRKIAGVVDTGLFLGMAEKAFFGHEDGSVSVRQKP